MSEERTNVNLTAAEVDLVLMLLDRELESVKLVTDLASKLRTMRSRPTTSREGESRPTTSREGESRPSRL
jgi:hypothetical protein